MSIVHLQIDQASSFVKEFVAKDDDTGAIIDLTGATLKAIAKPAFTSFNFFAFTATITDAVAGQYELTMTDGQTAALPMGSLVYDVKAIFPNGTSKRLVQGKISISPAITDANPFVMAQGVRLTDPRVVHIHSNLNFLENFGSAPVVKVSGRAVLSGERLFVDSMTEEIVLIVPDVPEDGFMFEVYDLMTNWPINNLVIKNESGTEIHRETTQTKLLIAYINSEYGWVGF